MEGTSFKCNCGLIISRRKDRTIHEKTRKHLLAIQHRKETKAVINERDACIHHWTIDASNGPHSDGYCLRCGLQGQFANSLETSTGWGGSSTVRKQRAKASYNTRNT